MQYKITGEQPFQVLSSSFSISPSEQDYVLQVSSNGIDYSDLFSVSAGQTKMCTSMANGSFYRLKNNESEVTVNWVKDCGGGGSGSGAQGPQGLEGPQGYQGATGAQGPAGSGSQGGDGHILKSVSATPETIESGDVYAFNGMKDMPADPNKPFSSVTMSTGQSISFYFYVGAYDGKTTYQGGYTSEGNLWGPWGVTGDVIDGPWGSEHGVEVTVNGDEVTFTTLDPTSEYSVWMCDFNPVIMENVAVKRAYLYDLEDGDKYVYGFKYSDIENLVNEDDRIIVNHNEDTYGNFRLTGDTFIYRDTVEKTNYEMSEFTDTWESVGNDLYIRVIDGYVYIYSEIGESLSFSTRNGGDVPAYSEGQGIGGEYGLAFEKDLPAENRLIPMGGNNYQFLRKVENGTDWADIAPVPNYDGSTDVGKVLTVTSEYGYGWASLPDALEAVSALPETTKDGDVYAYANASGYGIAQAQSGTTGYAWAAAGDGMTGWTQARVPYASNDSYVVISTETNTGGIGFGWNGSVWDNSDIQSQVDGEFTQEFDGGVICTCVRDGDYLVMTFNMPCIGTWSNNNSEFYMPSVIPNYVNAVMSDAVTKIWKGSQADYNNLGTYDNNTFYIIL